MNNLSGFEAYNSPEFRAFCKRFGIRHELMTTTITLIFPCEGDLEVVQTYRVLEDPNVIETTTPTSNIRTFIPVERKCEGKTDSN